MAADEGLVTGEASETLRQREALGVDVKILADVLVKHAVPLGNQDLGLMARETAQRGLADGLIISGPATGLPTLRSDVAQASSAVPQGGGKRRHRVQRTGTSGHRRWRHRRHQPRTRRRDHQTP